MVRRLLFLVPVIFLALLLTFVLTRVTKGDPLARVRSPFLTTEQVQSLRDEYHLNDSIPKQFTIYVADAVRGNFGISFTTARPVSHDLIQRLPISLELVAAGMVVAIVVGGGLGLAGALWPGSVADVVGRVVALAAVSIPVFWSSLLLLFLFFYKLNWLPGPGVTGGSESLSSITGFPILDAILHGDANALRSTSEALVLPALALGLSLAPLMVRIVRQSVGEALRSDFVRAALGFGLSRRTVLFHHALPAAAPPILTTIGTLTGFAIGGNILVEIVFSWGGLGQYAYEAILASDFPAIEGFVLLMTALYIVIFLLVDVVVAWIDPRAELPH